MEFDRFLINEKGLNLLTYLVIFVSMVNLLVNIFSKEGKSDSSSKAAMISLKVFQIALLALLQLYRVKRQLKSFIELDVSKHSKWNIGI